MPLIWLSGPMPFQLVNDSSTEAIAGNQTRTSTNSVGITVISVTTTRSPPESLRTRFLRAETGVRGPSPGPVSGRGAAVGWAVIARRSRREDRLLLALDALGEPVDVVGSLDELLQRRDHHRRREVGARVAVEELRDLLGAADELHGLLLQLAVARGVGARVDGDNRGVGLDVNALRGGRAEVAEELLGRGLVLRVRRHHEAVDRGLDRRRPDRGVDLGEREEVQVLLVGALGELLADEHAQHVHPGLLLLQRLRGLLPGAAQRS